MKRNKYRKDFIWKAYDYALSGFSQKAISESLGMAYPTYVRYKKRYKAFNNAIMEGMKAHRRRKELGEFSLRDFVYNKLPGDLQQVYKEINDCFERKTPLGRLDSILEDSGRHARMALWFQSWFENDFNKSEA